ncbi:DUF1657 domain-containing protein [Calorimonas adulescens]|jgi:Protein of unknown function (DUF1657).|uniref:DUF1657 domain-containing protein n=1 Tax=Calorimonas adulescens TaxID=2606906 RepID=A0A5D8Q9V3_9THEO|nr:DUF1657 domain-containing protein [Calorimonas adulescens]TZE81157.1 DUF1657 domain-containing protein [Calorimonas adulescens]
MPDVNALNTVVNNLKKARYDLEKFSKETDEESLQKTYHTYANQIGTMLKGLEAKSDEGQYSIDK